MGVAGTTIVVAGTTTVTTGGVVETKGVVGGAVIVERGRVVELTSVAEVVRNIDVDEVFIDVINVDEELVINMDDELVTDVLGKNRLVTKVNDEMFAGVKVTAAVTFAVKPRPLFALELFPGSGDGKCDGDIKGPAVMFIDGRTLAGPRKLVVWSGVG